MQLLEVVPASTNNNDMLTSPKKTTNMYLAVLSVRKFYVLLELHKVTFTYIIIIVYSMLLRIIITLLLLLLLLLLLIYCYY